MTALLLLTSPRGTLSAVGGGSAAGPSHSRHAAFFRPTVANGSLRTWRDLQLAPRLVATALNTISSPLFYAYRHVIMERAAAAHLPTIYEFPESAEEGGFAAYGPRPSELFLEIMPRQVVQLFRGTKVADIPVEQASKFELVINLKTAKAMGVTVPEALLVRADKVIE
jgi:hypothetical protein